MIQITTNADVFTRQLDAAILALEQQVNEAYWNWTMKPFAELAEGTPQWSGDTAANWFYSLNAPSGEYQQVMGKSEAWGKPGAKFEPYQRGAFMAVTMSVQRALEAPRPTYKDKVFFTNNTPIAFDLENQLVSIRPVNLLDGVVMMAAFIEAKYRNLPYDNSKFFFA